MNELLYLLKMKLDARSYAMNVLMKNEGVTDEWLEQKTFFNGMLETLETLGYDYIVLENGNTAIIKK